MGKPNFGEEFKRDAVHQITVRGYPVREVSERLGVSTYSLYKSKVSGIGSSALPFSAKKAVGSSGSQG